MGLQVVIDTVGVPQLNGTYDLDFEFTMGELDLIREHARLRGLEIDEAMDKGDTTLILCFGLIGALRVGRLQNKDVREAVAELMKEKVGTVSLTESKEAEDTPEASAGSEPGETPNSSSETTTQLSNGHQETTLEATGVPI